MLKNANKKYHTVGAVPKSAERDTIDTPYYNTWLFTFLAWYRHFNKKWNNAIMQVLFTLELKGFNLAIFFDRGDSSFVSFILAIVFDRGDSSFVSFNLTKKLLSVFPLFMTNMLSFLRTRLPTISCSYVNHITSNA